MKIKDLLCSSEICVNCNVKIFDATNGDYWYESKPVYEGDNFDDIPNEVQNMLVSYIFVAKDTTLIIEAIKV